MMQELEINLTLIDDLLRQLKLCNLEDQFHGMSFSFLLCDIVRGRREVSGSVNPFLLL